MTELTMVCTLVKRIKEHGVESNLVTLGSRERDHDVIQFEEFVTPSNYTVGREYKVTVEAICNG